MAKKAFLLQGFTPQTHREAILGLFDVDEVQRVIISVAFVNRGGVELLEDELAKHSGKITALIGIRNDITTLQGAQHLLDLGVELYTVDTGTRRVLFHPKIYLVRGTKLAKLIIGSANFTPGGLNNNVEAGIVIECDLDDPADLKLIDGIQNSFQELSANHPDNIKLIDSSTQLDAQHAIGLLLDEMAASPPKPSSSGVSTLDDTTPRIKLHVNPVFGSLTAAKRAAAKPVKAAAAQGAGTPIDDAAGAQTEQELADGVELELVWQSKDLTRRDLGVPIAGRNTNRTGSINLDKGLLPDDVDHRHYFREEIFDALDWSPANARVDEAYARFQMVVKGVSYGDFDLRIAHTTSITSRSYEQRNAMTRLSWGLAREYVATPDLIDRRLSLYRDNANPKRFVLEID